MAATRPGMAFAMFAAVLALAGCKPRNASTGGAVGGGLVGNADAPAQSGTAFLQLAARDAPAAYASSAAAFRAANGPNAWAAIVQVFDLDRFLAVDWSARHPQADGSLVLSGTLYAKSGVPRPIELHMVAGSGGGWQVAAAHLNSVASTIVGEGAAAPGLAIGTPTWSASRLAQVCSLALAPLRVHGCGRPIALAPGATGLCYAERDGRMVGVTAAITAQDAVSREGTAACRVTD